MRFLLHIRKSVHTQNGRPYLLHPENVRIVYLVTVGEMLQPVMVKEINSLWAISNH